MALYRFKCKDCGSEIEHLVSYLEASSKVFALRDGKELVKCQCGSTLWKKVFSGAHARTAQQWSH